MSQRSRAPLRIAEACRYVGVSRGTLLHAEQRGEVTPSRTPGGHRRYDPDHLDEVLVRWSAAGGDRPPPRSGPPTDRQLEAFTADGSSSAVGAASSARVDPAWVRADLSGVSRLALRRLVRLVGAHAGGFWLRTSEREHPLRFCGGFRLPRWLTDRLEDTDPPPTLFEVLGCASYRMVPSDDLGVQGEVVGGQALAVPVQVPRSIGVVAMFAANDHRWSPEELRLLREAVPLLAQLIDQALAIERLEQTLGGVRRLAGVYP